VTFVTDFGDIEINIRFYTLIREKRDNPFYIYISIKIGLLLL
jgi:hypothetical protein